MGFLRDKWEDEVEGGAPRDELVDEFIRGQLDPNRDRGHNPAPIFRYLAWLLVIPVLGLALFVLSRVRTPGIDQLVAETADADAELGLGRHSTGSTPTPTPSSDSRLAFLLLYEGEVVGGFQFDEGLMGPSPDKLAAGGEVGMLRAEIRTDEFDRWLDGAEPPARELTVRQVDYQGNVVTTYLLSGAVPLDDSSSTGGARTGEPPHRKLRFSVDSIEVVEPSPQVGGGDSG